MIDLFLFFVVGLSGVIAFTIWGLTRLWKKHKIKRGKMSIRFHYTNPDGKTAVTVKEINHEEYFNFSQKDLKNARKYLQDAIEDGKLSLETTLEQSNQLIENERKKDEQGNTTS